MRIMEMLARALERTIAFLPNLLAALVILAIGFLIATGLGRLTQRLIGAAGLERRHFMRQFVGDESALAQLPRAAGRIVYWVVAFITIGMAVDSLHLVWLSAGVAAVLAYLPNALTAAAIIAVGYFVGNVIYRRLLVSESISPFWSRAARTLTLVVAGFMALQQLGIATAIVTAAFTICLGAIAVAGAVAFGLGNRELAGQITRDWYERRGAPLLRPEARFRSVRDALDADQAVESRH